MDALLSTCMLMGAQYLCPEAHKLTDCWVLSAEPTAMNWLYLQGGMRCLLDLARPYIHRSIWAAISKETDHEISLFDDPCQNQEELHSGLADLCQVNDTTTPENNPCYIPLKMLSSMLKLDPCYSNIPKFLDFTLSLQSSYLHLLQKKDPCALVIIAHWMGLMCLTSQWQPWVDCRIRTECVAICIYLESSTDRRILKLLEYPSRACGYPLRCISEDSPLLGDKF